MLIGELIFKHADWVYTGILNRVTGGAVFAIQTLQISGTSFSMSAEVQHRNAIDDSWSTAGSFSAITTATTTTLSVSNLKELIRIRIQLNAGTDTWARLFIFNPVWT